VQKEEREPGGTEELERRKEKWGKRGRGPEKDH
jgi:hypothetical protein